MGLSEYSIVNHAWLEATHRDENDPEAEADFLHPSSILRSPIVKMALPAEMDRKLVLRALEAK
jgi:hypothetical protein